MGTLPHSHEDDAERLSRIVETQRDIVAAAGDLDTVTRLVLESSCSLTGADGAMLSLVEGADWSRTRRWASPSAASGAGRSRARWPGTRSAAAARC